MLDLVVQASNGTDTDLLIAAILHDVVEDTPTSYEKIAAKFGECVAQIVRENSDDVSMPKAECQVEIMYRCKLLAKSAP